MSTRKQRAKGASNGHKANSQAERLRDKLRKAEALRDHPATGKAEREAADLAAERCEVKLNGHPIVIRPSKPYEAENGTLEVTHVRKRGEYIAELVKQGAWLKFAIARKGSNQIEYADTFDTYAPCVWLKSYKALRVPSAAEPHGNLTELAAEVRAFIHRYFDCDDNFESVAALYVLMTWIYERFHAVPYLRFIGLPGTGKSRATKVIGACCYRSVFFGGATNSAPIYRLLEVSGGTLLLDEADYTYSQIGSDIAKILNSGYAQDSDVPRCTERDGQYIVESFDAFGPKILNGRKQFRDDATESRCLTYSPGVVARADIPAQLPLEQFEREALAIRNKALDWRLRNFDSFDVREIETPGVGRSKELLQPLLLIAEAIEDARYRDELLTFAREREAQLVENSADLVEVLLVEEYLNAKGQVRVGELVAEVIKNNAGERLTWLTPRRASEFLRSMGFKTKKDYRGAKLSIVDAKLQKLIERFGLDKRKVA